MGLSLDTTPLAPQSVFYVGEEGGTLNIVAYLRPFTKREGKVKDKLNPTIEFNGTETMSLSDYTMTRRSDTVIVYSFKIAKNTTGKQLGCGAMLKDTTGLGQYESLDRIFYVFQSAEWDNDEDSIEIDHDSTGVGKMPQEDRPHMRCGSDFFAPTPGVRVGEETRHSFISVPS